MRQRRQHLGTDVAADIDHVPATVVVDALGQGQVITRAYLGPRSHGCTKAQASWLGAVDRDDEYARQPSDEAPVGMGALAENTVEHRDSGEIAGTHTKKGIGRGILRWHAVRGP